MAKIIGIATSDWHIHKFRNFNQGQSRLSYALQAVQEIALIADKLNVPVFFSGDLFHTPKEVENLTISTMLQTFYNCFEKTKTKFIAISGNHDFSERNGINHWSPSYLDSFNHFSQFIKLDYDHYKGEKFTVWGLPYMNNDQELSEAIKELYGEVKNNKAKLKILMLHSDAPGAVTPAGIEINETKHIPRNLDKFFKPWDLVLFGHIHKPQRLSNKCYMLGSPIHQDAGDKGTIMGYWEIWSNGVMVFKPLEQYPQFRQLSPGETPPDNFNYWVESEQILVENNINYGEYSIKNSREKLAKAYCKNLGIKSKKFKRALIEILNIAE